MKGDEAIAKQFNEAQDRLVLQAADLSLEAISKMVEKKSIDIAPQFQRRDRWPIEKQSALIESFLLNVPVPPVYLMEDDYGTYSVIDGKQRITAINMFMENRILLQGLEEFKGLEGRNFSELPRQLKNALEVRPYVRVVTLLRQSAKELKFEVFTRLNRGGEPLNAQEIRNVIYRGPLNDLIYEKSNLSFLRHQLKIRNDSSPAYREMADAELVLRFFAIRKSWEDFSGDYRRSMDDFMEASRDLKASEIRLLGNRFDRALHACEEIFGVHAFQRAEAGNWRNQMMTGLYDAQMIAADQLSDQELARAITKKSQILTGMKQLFDDPEFEEAVRRATNTPSRLQYRINKTTTLLRR